MLVDPFCFRLRSATALGLVAAAMAFAACSSGAATRSGGGGGGSSAASAAGAVGSGGAAGSTGSGGTGAGTSSGGASGGVGTTGGNTGSGGRGTGGGAAGVTGAGGAIVGSGGAGAVSCTPPPPAGALTGWAAVDGMGVPTTTGGGTAAPVTVATAADLISNAAGTTTRVIYVNGNLTGTFSIGSNKTVVGLCGASLHGHVSLSNASNVIVRNLTIVGNNCTDSPADCSGGADAVTVGNNSHHVWFDHDDIYDGSDGNLDITSGADFVTISWTKFRYSSARSDAILGANGHRFSNLIGSSDTTLTDTGHLNVTFHHNWWAENVNQRMPRTRFGKIHVFNNLFTSVGNSYCTNAGFMATLLVENNIYIGVQGPLQEDANGSMLAVGNLMQNTTGGTAMSAAIGPGFVPTYPYTLEDATGATSTLAATIMSQVGPR